MIHLDTSRWSDLSGVGLSGGLAIAAAGLCAGFLAFWPLDTVPAPSSRIDPPPLVFKPGAFLDKAPFDPRHRPGTSRGTLQPAAGPTTAPPVQEMVLGILLDGEVRRAMLASDPTHWYVEGSEVGGWLLRQIEPETVTMSRGTEIRVLTYGSALSSLSH